MIHVELIMVQVQEKNHTAIHMGGGVEQALERVPVAVPHHALHRTLVVGKLHLFNWVSS
jgi:hypothetical protein